MSDVIFEINDGPNNSTDLFNFTNKNDDKDKNKYWENFYKTVKTIGMYEIVSKSGLLVTIGLCYKYQPVSTLTNTQIGKNVINYSKNKFPKTTEMINKGSQKFSLLFQTNKYLRYIPQTFGLKTRKFATAARDSFFVYHAMVPIYAAIALKFSILSDK